MKKSLLIISFLSTFLIGCPPLPQYQIDSVVYKAITRGNSESIVISRDERPNVYKANLVHEKNNQQVFKKKFKNKDFKHLYKVLKKLDLNSIDTLTAPSKKHQYDGAMLTTIEIGYGKEVYKSVPFDHGNPPKELKELLDYVKSLVNKKADD